MHPVVRSLVGAAVVTALLTLTTFATPASAHERREVGQYVVVVGFLHEPAFVEQLNAASITIFRKDGTPVEGAHRDLKVEIGTGGTTRTLDLGPEPGKPGAYKAEFIPTKTGSYTFRFFGKVENQDFNEKFESGPNRFDEVVSPAELQFPVKVPTNAELAAQAGGTGAATAAAPGATAADVQRALDEAERARTAAMRFGIAGIAAGLLGMVLGALALRSRGSRPAPSPSRGGQEPV